MSRENPVSPGNPGNIVVLDRPGRPLPPYPQWLDTAPILLTGRPPSTIDATGYADVLFLPGLDSTAKTNATVDDPAGIDSMPRADLAVRGLVGPVPMAGADAAVDGPAGIDSIPGADLAVRGLAGRSSLAGADAAARGLAGLVPMAGADAAVGDLAGVGSVAEAGLAVRDVSGADVAVRGLVRRGSTTGVDLVVCDLAVRGGVAAVVAVDFADQVRAGGLRDLLGLPGQSRDAALPLVDPVVAGAMLRRAGVPVVRRAGVRRVCDLYWFAHRWGYPLLVRRRRAAGRPVVAELRDEMELRAFAVGRLPADPSLVPDLTVESPVRGERHRGPGLAVTDAALALLPDTPGHPRVVEAVRAEGGEWLVDTVHYDPVGAATRAAVRAQAAPPDSAPPDSALPGTALPGTALPGTALPGTALPGAVLPATALPSAFLPAVLPEAAP